MRLLFVVSLLSILLLISVSVYVYPAMPASISSHWNSSGQVDGTMSKFWGVFLIPLIALILFVLLETVTHIDPLKKNILSFRSTYDLFIFVFLIFLFYIQILLLIWNSGHTYNIMLYLLPALSVLFFFIGILLSKVQQNWFIGIRTPWTLSSTIVWEKTHQRASIVFKIASILMLFGLFFPIYVVYLVLCPILLAAMYSVAYSYYVFRRLGKKN